MLALKVAIFQELRSHYGGIYEVQSDSEMNTLVFHTDSLRLTLKGFMLVKSIFTAYSFELPATLKSKHQKAMSKMEYPYFFTAKRLILFSEMDAMVIKMHGGVEGFLEVCSQI